MAWLTLQPVTWVGFFFVWLFFFSLVLGFSAVSDHYIRSKVSYYIGQPQMVILIKRNNPETPMQTLAERQQIRQ